MTKTKEPQPSNRPWLKTKNIYTFKNRLKMKRNIHFQHICHGWQIVFGWCYSLVLLFTIPNEKYIHLFVQTINNQHNHHQTHPSRPPEFTALSGKCLSKSLYFIFGFKAFLFFFLVEKITFHSQTKKT